ncbi:hypothetical protein BC831DRAFT_467701 [Entophlyctis helioformis]|nr:hypothetical protein BC831DRAFT_467701 [Entophlyctis helioformis]
MATTFEPELAKPGPYGIELEPGRDYYWCSCGKSKSQPFCDGSHKGTGMTPQKFSVTEKRTYWLCGCKISDGKPFCDGMHNKEKGVRKYNEFLLKKNTALQLELEQTRKRNTAISTGAVILGTVGIAAFIATRLQSK